MTNGLAGDHRHRIEQAIEQRVRARAVEWFPSEHRTPHLRIRPLSDRPRSLLFAVHLGDGTSAPRVLAKVRREAPVPDAGRIGPGRPRLSAGTLTAAELTALEFEGLRSIFAVFGEPSSGFGAVRPLDHLPAENTILMEFVDAHTLRQLLVQRSRLVVPRSRLGGADTAHVWRQAGAWLRVFQRSLPHRGLSERQPTSRDVVDRFGAYQEFLAGRLGRRSFGDVGTRGAQLAAEVLPERLPLVVGHGDYAPRNVFLRGDGRLAVFDPLLRWAVPCHEDLCRFLVGMRLLGVQVHTRGAAYGRQRLERLEQAVINGYYGDAGAPVAQLRCYQLLILLDKWSALVDAPRGRWPSRLRGASVDAATGYLRRQSVRLLELASASSG